MAVTTHMLTHSYGRKVALRDVDFQVPAGEFFCLLGPNGAGKSTLVRILTGQLRPTQGKAIVVGEDVVQHPEGVIYRIGVLPDDMSLPEELTVREVLLFAARAFGQTHREASQTTERLIREFGLEEHASLRIGHLSSGLRRRTEIAQALVSEGLVIFLDEPTIALDPISAEEVKQLVRAIHIEGRTIFYTTHLLQEVEELCQSFAIIDRGELRFQAQLETVRSAGSIRIRLHSPADLQKAEKALSRQGFTASAEGAGLMISTGEEAMDSILETLRAEGIRITSATFVRPTLKDVYHRVMREGA